MARKKTDKDKPTIDDSKKNISGILKNETTHFVIGLISIILEFFSLILLQI